MFEVNDRFGCTVQSLSRFENLLSETFEVRRTLPGFPLTQTVKTLMKCARLIETLLVVTLLFMISVSVGAQQTATGSKIRDPDPSVVRQPEAEPANANQPFRKTDPKEDAFTKPKAGVNSGFHWKAALSQSLVLLSLQRGVDIATESDTRVNLRGPFLKDYFRSVANTHGWRDGDPFGTNYVAHPFQGAITGFIEVQNDPKGMSKKFEWTKSYWMSRLKGMGWAAAYSTYFELGPGLSEAMIGNVGLPAQYRAAGSKPRPPNGGMGFVDMVVTPTLGTGWLVGEDILDRYVVAKIERHTNNTMLQVTARVVLNPARSSANLLRMQKPWHRDSRGRTAGKYLRDMNETDSRSMPKGNDRASRTPLLQPTRQQF